MCDKKISIVGAGMGTAEQLTGLGSRRLREAQVVVGAPRLTEGLSGELSGHAVLASHRTGEFVVFLNYEKMDPGGVSGFRGHGILQRRLRGRRRV